MANFDTSKKGMKNYARILQDCQTNNQVGVHLHLRQPQSPECRLGFKGRPVKAKEEKTTRKENTQTRKQKQFDKEIAKLQAAVAQFDPEAKKQKELEDKYKALQMAKVAAKLEVPQYGRNVLTAKNLKNSVG